MDFGQWMSVCFLVGVVVTLFGAFFGKAEVMGVVGASMIVIFGLACVGVAAGLQVGIR